MRLPGGELRLNWGSPLGLGAGAFLHLLPSQGGPKETSWRAGDVCSGVCGNLDLLSLQVRDGGGVGWVEMAHTSSIWWDNEDVHEFSLSQCGCP